MIKLKLVLDTNVFNNKEFCNWLLFEKEEKYLPAIVYMEYLHHHLKKGNTESMVDAFLEQMNISIIPFGKNEAIYAAKSRFRNWEFNEIANQKFEDSKHEVVRNAREYAIGSTALNLNAILVTNNLKGFKWMDDVLTPDEILENYKNSKISQP